MAAIRRCAVPSVFFLNKYTNLKSQQSCQWEETFLATLIVTFCSTAYSFITKWMPTWNRSPKNNLYQCTSLGYFVNGRNLKSDVILFVRNRIITKFDIWGGSEESPEEEAGERGRWTRRSVPWHGINTHSRCELQRKD